MLQNFNCWEGGGGIVKNLIRFSFIVGIRNASVMNKQIISSRAKNLTACVTAICLGVSILNEVE